MTSVVATPAKALPAKDEPRPLVMVPFVCPICAGPNEVHLITLSRAGSMNCAKCGKKLRVPDVMKAMHAPRKAGP